MFSISGYGLILLVTVKATASVHALPLATIKKIKEKREETFISIISFVNCTKN